ncbi:FHA domain-containing protein [Sanguibacter gelidistatuariae]|uniref:FHA domain-containing protein n=1 Tax=Sanguibacter gelidistatuariae TaxID=1814289 RepID=A0A1G6UR85_9MICO|nr:FHA domain-containing protein [Sanguibacter gelidistatuariae]SDD43075.1 FHA domain-containing protein [Sanguibacter gelidistatuariae]
MIIPMYVSGDWYAVVTDGAVALLPPTISETKLTQVWDALRESADLTHSLTALARGGLVGLPPFALVSVVDGHVRGFLRGDVRLLITDSHGTQEHTAEHVATWAEINVPDAAALTVAVPAALSPTGRTVRMPALAAVVAASSVEVRLRDGAIAAPSLVAPRATADDTAAETTTYSDLDLPAPVARRALQPEPARAVVQAPAPAPHPAPVRALEAALPAGLASRPVPGPPPPPPVKPETDEDPYGSTVLSTSLVEIRRQMPSWQEDPVPGPFAIPPVPARVPRIRMSSGLSVPLDRAVLIGRAPVVSRVAARDLPRLVTVVSPNQDISRTHAQVRVDGEDVLVTDLNSTNGMLLVEPGLPPRRLRSGEPTPLRAHAVVDLGDDVTFTLESDS